MSSSRRRRSVDGLLDIGERREVFLVVFSLSPSISFSVFSSQPTPSFLHASLSSFSFFCVFIEETANLTPEERAKKLETDSALALAHKSYETKGQSSVPTPERSDVDTHFVAFVYDEKTGRLYELDGRKNTPIDHGSVLSEKDEKTQKKLEDVQGLRLLRKAVDVIKKEFVEKSPPGELRFQLIAVESARS